MEECNDLTYTWKESTWPLGSRINLDKVVAAEVMRSDQFLGTVLKWS